MRVNPYGEDPLRLAVRLVNEPVHSAAELQVVCQQAGVVLERPVSKTDLAQTYRMLDDWLAVLDAEEAEQRAQVLNQLLASSATYPSLTDHQGDGWHLHYREENLALWQILRTMLYVGTALHLAGRGMNRLGRCQATNCERIYVDFSRPGSQRYCSPACANRSAVQRHRDRSRGIPAGNRKVSIG
ncbi:CGNR zinc finger domain-containing protein [Psychromicrobium lacuslunae]|uniref:Zinc finger CGNR domain-containing protein n=1 Tax=Psychromicrobium lacuslunae TaxID=1618207 RepID=A0A0D4BYV1_9MICC|nr:CGNR zinc finger domain-containing protein [Psychromicrobium lacuslunae]AJT41612.1 hypothetical protein UM93_08975 [Psychromicrobium lacuslunae]